MPTELVEVRSETGAPVEVYPPLAAKKPAAPLVVMLHGMCSDPRSTCDFWSNAGREGSWLVCPAGNGTCGDAFDWSGPAEARANGVDAGMRAMERAFQPLVDHEPGDVLVGFSRGAFLARDMIYARPGRFRGVVLLGAALKPDAARFLAAGVHRVVLAAGD